jgi:hypothetical protein
LPESWHGKRIVGVLGMHCGAPEDGKRAVQPLRELGNPIADLTGPMPYVGMQSSIDGLWAAAHIRT